VPALVSALKNAEPLVRGHAAWALGQMATTQAIKGLEQSTESDPYVLEEIAAAIKESRRKPSQASSLAR
jgi:epoxyqueuosine reductase